jgi:hypothetical protein
MQIHISKKTNRNSLTCIRADGSYTRSDTGPSLPHHDLAHYVVESALDLKNGFYGMVSQGYSIQELSDKEVIKKLGPESWLAEIVTRTLQSFTGGACTAQQFSQLITTELNKAEHELECGLSPQAAEKMKSDFLKLLQAWQDIPDGESLELSFRN